MPPSIIPNKGTITAFFTFILFKISINKKLPPRANVKDINILVNTLPLENIISATKTPSFAESAVDAVVGETNLF